MNLDDCYSREELKMKKAALAFMSSLEQPGAKSTAFARQMARYVISFPERATGVAENHCRDFFVFKQKNMAREALSGVRKNPLIAFGKTPRKNKREKYGGMGLQRSDALMPRQFEKRDPR